MQEIANAIVAFTSVAILFLVFKDMGTTVNTNVRLFTNQADERKFIDAVEMIAKSLNTPPEEQ